MWLNIQTLWSYFDNQMVLAARYICNIQLNKRDTLPSQCFPSPLKPALHVHLYEPWVVWQIASMWQPSLPSAHGSAEIHKGLIGHDCQKQQQQHTFKRSSESNSMTFTIYALLGLSCFVGIGYTKKEQQNVIDKL